MELSKKLFEVVDLKVLTLPSFRWSTVNNGFIIINWRDVIN